MYVVESTIVRQEFEHLKYMFAGHPTELELIKSVETRILREEIFNESRVEFAKCASDRLSIIRANRVGRGVLFCDPDCGERNLIHEKPVYKTCAGYEQEARK